ncbi:MAG: family 43 glycosylhydrolase [Lachnospira sp.]|nr:family 43 glycosylhydrolase [Lachnospira sp.]
MKKQVYNPFLPLYEYIPDGEPHVFGNRVYLYGSHDREGGHTFCMEDYVVYSAPINNLTDWKYEGVSYRANQDPDYSEFPYMYAPDVVQGNDGNFYLYYCMAGEYGIGGYKRPISVAVSQYPAGPFEYLDHIHFDDDSIMKKYVCFDPAVINDNGTIRIYYGTRYDFEEREDFDQNEEYIKQEMEMFGKTKEEILSYRSRRESCISGNPNDSDSVMGPVMAVLCDDMVTIKEEPHHIIPYKVKGTSFEAHPFFEGASMRKINDTYYFIYSSWQNHELCYATSVYPDHDFVFRGTIVSNGDVGFQGRTNDKKVAMTGTTHGSIELINGQWYVFYHRLTHKSDYSRQSCAEKISIDENGSISQVEITSCGLNEGPLAARVGMHYPAVIACNLTNGHMPHGSNSIYQIEFPNVTNKGDERFIAEIEDGTFIGYKYFSFAQVDSIGVVARIESEENKVVYDGPLRVDVRCMDDQPVVKENESEEYKASVLEIRLEENGPTIGEIAIGNEVEWTEYKTTISVPDGEHALFFVYHGSEKIQLKEVFF